MGRDKARVNQKNNILKSLVENGVDKNKYEIDIKLAAFRQLPRRLCEIWYPRSAFNGEIRKCLHNISRQLDEIDKEYGLG